MDGASESPHPELRASDAEREEVAGRLQTGFSEGRLTYDELQERLEQTYAARTHADLDGLLGDLPAAPITRSRPETTAGAPGQPGMPGPFVLPRHIRRAARRRGSYGRSFAGTIVPFAVLSIFLIAMWATGGHHGRGSFWPGFPILIFGVILVMRFVRGMGR